jgi:DNA-binding transcriptional ArsR family regulator
MKQAVSHKPAAIEAARQTPTLRKVQLKAKLWRGLSDPSRLAILEVLRPRPLCVSDIVEATGLLQSNVSNHLACLYECGLVSRNPEGRFVRYGLSDRRVEVLLRLAEELLADTAQGVIECMNFSCSNKKC